MTCPDCGPTAYTLRIGKLARKSVEALAKGDDSLLRLALVAHPLLSKHGQSLRMGLRTYYRQVLREHAPHQVPVLAAILAEDAR